MQKWRTLVRNTRRLVVTNWPIKVLALALSAVLWAATAAQEPTTQLVPVRLDVDPPEGRALQRQLPQVQALFAGSTRELIKLYAQPPTITKTIPDTVSGSEYTLELSTADLSGIDNVKVTAQDVQPRLIPVQLDEVLERTVPVIHRVAVRSDSGYALAGGIAIAPSAVLARGPEVRIRNLTAVYTLPLEISDVSQPVRRTIAIDTAGLSPVRLSRYEVDVSADIVPVSERVIDDVPVSVRSERPVRWQVQPPSVSVTLSGPTARLARLTVDSVDVLAFADPGRREQTVSITVIPPSGISARAVPDTVVVRSRPSR